MLQLTYTAKLLLTMACTYWAIYWVVTFIMTQGSLRLEMKLQDVMRRPLYQRLLYAAMGPLLIPFLSMVVLLIGAHTKQQRHGGGQADRNHIPGYSGEDAE